MLERLEHKVKDKYIESGKMGLFGIEITCNFIAKEKASKLSCCIKSLQNANKKIKNCTWILSKLICMVFAEKYRYT